MTRRRSHHRPPRLATHAAIFAAAFGGLVVPTEAITARAPQGRAQQPASAAESGWTCHEDPGLRALLATLCERIASGDISSDVLYVNAYLMRTLVAGATLLDEPRYLDVAIASADELVRRQSPRGYWTTGYDRGGDYIYLADTGSALGLLAALDGHVDDTRRSRYLECVVRYARAVQSDGLVHESGALGTGWRWDPRAQSHTIYPDEYTISSALTGGVVFSWLHHRTRERRYQEVATAALRWIFSRMRPDGVLPYVLAGENADWNLQHRRRHAWNLWSSYPYNTSAYVGEGLIAFDAFTTAPGPRAELRERVRPHVEFLLRTQTEDGTWGRSGGDDQKRSPGVVNLLTWYHRHVHRDARIGAALDRFAAFLGDEANALAFGLCTAGAAPTRLNATVTGLTGRAVADLLAGPEPGEGPEFR